MARPLPVVSLPPSVAVDGAPRRVLDVDLGALDERVGDGPRVWRPADDDLAWIASWGGTALALAWLASWTRRAPAAGVGDVPLVVAAGEAVARGVPTAARASVTGRAPLTGRLGEGQVGGELGARLARVADALVLRGRVDEPGAVLVVDAAGRPRLERRPELAGADVATTRAALLDAGRDAHLCVGPAGERGVAFASLAGGSGEGASFVGRGGLGAAFGRLGLKALVLEAPRAASEVPHEAPSDARRGELLAALVRSPRLAARATEGSLELFAAQAARGDAPADAVRALLGEARERAREREGCRGCPTPCGWTFERSDGARQGGRFNATEALGAALGLDGLDAPLRLLAACDRVGVDAKEVGALLALSIRAQETGALDGPPLRGDAARLEERVLALADPEQDGRWARAARGGALAFARTFGVEEAARLSRGQAAREVANDAALLGQLVSTGGADPMRSFPFLVEDAGRAAIERLAADLGPLPGGAADPRSPAGKGRLVYWHENLVSGVDATGFCTFSMAGLLADGVAELDALAGWILPAPLRDARTAEWAALSPGRRLVAAGANLVLLRHALERAWRAPELEVPAWARERLLAPGMLDEYRAFRGLDATGAVDPERWARLGTPGALAPAAAGATRGSGAHGGASVDSTAATTPRARGRAELRASGALAEALGATASVELELPAPVRDVLRAAARGDERLAARLLRGDAPIPSVWRAGERLEPEDLVRDGDALDLVVAISGG